MTRNRTRRILIVLTSHARLGNTGRSTGAYLPEVAHPWKVFVGAGYAVDLASVAGGRPPLDGVDPADAVQQEFLADRIVADQLAHTISADEASAADYDAVFYPGGHGTMWDFPGNADLAGITREIYERGGVVGAVCHGPAALVDVVLSNGRQLVDGKEVSAFTDEEEQAVGLADEVPFLLQTALQQQGAKHSGAAKFQPWVVVDGRLVTGQNPASARGVANAVLNSLESPA